MPDSPQPVGPFAEAEPQGPAAGVGRAVLGGGCRAMLFHHAGSANVLVPAFSNSAAGI